MLYADVWMVEAKPEEVSPDPNEMAQRLGTARGYTDERIRQNLLKLQTLVRYRAACLRTPVDLSEENCCRFDFMTARSRCLWKNLQGCREAFVFAVTTGLRVDRELSALSVTSPADRFVLDALSSAAVDAFCQKVADGLSAGLSCAPRFSPGYGDLSLMLQQPLLQRLGASERLGITLSAAYLMTPVKSITAIMGIRYEKDNGIAPNETPVF